jgi:hypothetical protein
LFRRIRFLLPAPNFRHALDREFLTFEVFVPASPLRGRGKVVRRLIGERTVQTHGVVIDAPRFDQRLRIGHPDVKEIYLAAYKSKMTGSEFIERMSRVRSRNRKSKQRSSYRNAHKMHERYLHLDARFNFFGNYPEA